MWVISVFSNQNIELLVEKQLYLMLLKKLGFLILVALVPCFF
jgi:hypothetical protein